ncbi:hypothetical protein MMC06_005543 [Schaereria dolodes]|nr:hypothetical protein [Schaereria dolodes]
MPVAQKQRDFGLFIAERLPAILMFEVVGTIEKVGADVTNYKPGDLIFGISNIMRGNDGGALQQYTVLEPDFAARVPSSITDDEACTIQCNATTAYIALFHPSGLNIPVPGSKESKSFDYAGQTLIIVGGGADIGKYGIQFAALAGIGRIIAVSSLTSAKDLKSYGATHIIDRHLSVAEIRKQVQEITSDEIIYVYDTSNTNHTLAVSLLSSSKRGKIAGAVPSQGVDETVAGKKAAGYDIIMISGHPGNLPDREFGQTFWKNLPGWIESGSIKPLSYKVIEGGVNAAGVNKVLDDYRDQKNPGRWHIHPNDS